MYQILKRKNISIVTLHYPGGIQTTCSYCISFGYLPPFLPQSLYPSPLPSVSLFFFLEHTNTEHRNIMLLVLIFAYSQLNFHVNFSFLICVILENKQYFVVLFFCILSITLKSSYKSVMNCKR